MTLTNQCNTHSHNMAHGAALKMDASVHWVGERPPSMSEIRVGARLYGFCGGSFGRDSYDNKRVEAVGADWCVARQDDGEVVFSWGDPERLAEYMSQEPSMLDKDWW